VDADAPEAYRRMWEAAFGVRRATVLDRLATAVHARVPGEVKSAWLEPDGSPSSLRLRLASALAGPDSATTGRRRVVKSVNVPLALEWIAARFEPRVLVVRRHPLDVIASRLRFGSAFLENALGHLDHRAVATRVERWGAPLRPTSTDRSEHFYWLTGFTLSAFDEVAEANPDFHVVDYEDIAADPVAQFQRIVEILGLEWGPACEEFLVSSNTPGSGFETKRVATKQTGIWRQHLSDEQVTAVCRVLSRFPIVARYPELLELAR